MESKIELMTEKDKCPKTMSGRHLLERRGERDWDEDNQIYKKYYRPYDQCWACGIVKDL